MTTKKNSLNFSFWVFIVLAIIIAVFSVQNSKPIDVRLFLWDVNISLAILLIGTFLTGLVIGALYAYQKLKPRSEKEEETDNSDKAEGMKSDETSHGN
ncbi:LapA family protein [Geofilum sp. OHC36d9]|uniref:LapA family protein n=1 Tax=Geofilum sp. OHC36d9 TaxID=3458413 RepID=UPI0040340D85